MFVSSIKDTTENYKHFHKSQIRSISMNLKNPFQNQRKKINRS